MFTFMPAPVMAASSGGPLVKQVNVYYYNTANKWEQFSRYTFTYGNSYPKKYTEVEYSLETQNRLEYKMKKGLPVSAKNFRYINMINSFIAGDSDCYGEYNWY